MGAANCLNAFFHAAIGSSSFIDFYSCRILELTTLFIQGKMRREGFLCFLKDLNYSVLNRLRIVRA